MKSYIYLFVIVLIPIFACSRNKHLSSEQIIIKNHFAAGPYCFKFRLDTLREIKYIGDYMDSLALVYPGESGLYIGFSYNLADSTFIPSVDTSLNCCIPIGQGIPIHGKFAYGNDSFITDISIDSMSIQYMGNMFRSKISINELEGYFTKYFNNVLKHSNERILITIDISNNPPKDSFYQIFNTLFWTYHTLSFKKIKATSKVNFDELAKNSQVKPSVYYEISNLFLILLTRDSTGTDFHLPILAQ